MIASQLVDPGRLRRAALRHVKRIGPSRFLIEGRHEPEYLVDLDEASPCRCVDAHAHRGGCLHELAARLASGDVDLVHTLGEMLEASEREARTLRVQVGKRRSA